MAPLRRYNKKRKLGIAFGETLFKGKNFGHFKGKNIADESWKDTFLPNFDLGNYLPSTSSWTTVFIAIFILVSFFGLFLRLFHLQVAQGDYQRSLADSNRI